MRVAGKLQAEQAPSLQIGVRREHILPALAKAKSATQRRVTIPILANVMLVAKDGVVTLTGTDMETTISATFAAEMSIQGATTIPAVVLEKIVKSLPENAEIQISQVGEMVLIKCSDFSSSLRSLPVEDFPAKKAPDFSHSFALPEAALKKLIAKTSFALSTEETRYYLNGIYLHVTENGLASCATDGHRLALCTVPAPEGSAGMVGCIIPRAAVRLLSSTFPAGDVAVDACHTYVRFSSGGVSVLVKVIDGTFPEYQRIMPTGNDKSVIIERGAFSRALEQAASIVNERSAPIKYNLARGALLMSCVSHEYGTSAVSLIVWYEGSPVEIGFQARYVRDILKVIGNRVRLLLSDSLAPAIFADPDDDSCTYILMPMRV